MENIVIMMLIDNIKNIIKKWRKQPMLQSKNMLKCAIKRNVKPPCRAHKDDAGIDLFVPCFDKTFIRECNEMNKQNQKFYEFRTINDEMSLVIKPHGKMKLPSGTYFNIPQNNALIVFEKTSIGSKGLITGGRVVDENYCGEIIIALLNVSDQEIVLQSNNKFIQLVLMPVILDQPILVDFKDLYQGKVSERGEGAFGSTGK